MYFHIFSTRFECIFTSSPLVSSVDITFGTGELKGPQGVDTFTVGPYKVKKQTFALIEEEVKTTLETSGEDGKATLETSGEDVKTTLETSGEDGKATL